MNIAPLGKRVIAFGIDEIILATLFTIVLLVIDEPEIMAAAQSGSNLEISYDFRLSVRRVYGQARG